MLDGEGVGDEGEAPFHCELGVGEHPSESMCKLHDEGEADTQGLNSAKECTSRLSYEMLNW